MAEHEELAGWLEEIARERFVLGFVTPSPRKFTRAAALLREARPQPGWQPISTAPTDGTEILASDYDAIEIVSFSWSAWETGSGWIDRDGLRFYPAWWQPLPEHPPTPTEQPK